MVIQKQTIQFLTDLKKNNTKEWFESNRKKYEAAKENVQQITTSLIEQLGKVDENLTTLQMKECTFRINRDVRFSKNKAPYKTNMSAIFAKGGKKAETAGFYVHFEPGQSFIAAGFWSPEAKKLQSIRQEIDYNYNDFKKIISSKKFTNTFTNGLSKEQVLVRPPKGYDEENPAIEILKLKSFVVTKPLTDEEIQAPSFAKLIVESYKVVQPFLNFLNTAE